MIVELAWLIARGGWSATDAALRLAPGACMTLALKAALIGAGWPWIAAALALAFPIHLADLRRRRG